MTSYPRSDKLFITCLNKHCNGEIEETTFSEILFRRSLPSFEQPLGVSRQAKSKSTRREDTFAPKSIVREKAVHLAEFHIKEATGSSRSVEKISWSLGCCCSSPGELGGIS